MTQSEQERLKRDYEIYLWLLDYYTKNRNTVKSMTDKEYGDYIDAILDEINRLKALLAQDSTDHDKIIN